MSLLLVTSLSATALAAAAYSPRSTLPPLLSRLMASISEHGYAGVTRIAAVLLAIYSLHALVSQRLSSGAWFPRKLRPAEWKKQVVVVTGGSGGVGAQLTLLLARAGAKVAVVDVVPLPAELANFAGGQSKQIKWYKCDLSDWRSVQETGAAIRKDFGRVTMLVNNAGVVTPPAQCPYLVDGTPSTDSQAEAEAVRIQRTIDINLTSQFWTVREFAPDMLKAGSSGGHIVTVASIMGHVGVPGLADYVASKFGLVGLHQTIKREFRRHRGRGAAPVQTTLVLPSHISTPMFKHWTVPFPFNHLTPSVSPQAVAAGIFGALESQRSGQIYLPSLTSITRWHGVLPEGVYEVMQVGCGADDAVAGMKSRAGSSR
ncbi:unnamed protein product [Parajaminaea phylloscopi]